MLNSFLFRLYNVVGNRTFRKFIRDQICRIEGGEMYSPTLRRIFREFHRVDVGLYTHGGCFVPHMIDRHTTIGRYCSIAQNVRTMNRDHPMDFKSMHAFFFNPKLGYCKDDRIDFSALSIGNDVWIGTSALILPHARSIGDGAVIAAGAVVNKDVPPYSVVVGNPARVVRFRFPKEVIDELLASRWWEKPIEELDVASFNRPLLPASELASV